MKIKRSAQRPALVVGRNGRRDYRPGEPPPPPPVLPHQERCPGCGRGVMPLADGSLRAHQSSPGIPCAAVPSRDKTTRAPLCAHGNFPTQRKQCGCYPRGDGTPPPPRQGRVEPCPGCGKESKVLADGVTLFGHKPCGPGMKVD